MSDKVRLTFAVVITIVFVAFGAFLVTNADTTNQTEWQRWVYVFGAAEAIAFAALGWVFGREVNRQRAETAERDAESAKEQTQEEMTKGATLAGLVVGGAGGDAGRRRLEPLGTGGGGGLDEALAYARAHYIDRGA
jgi:hypothetical protein